MILGRAFEQEGSGAGGGERDTPICARKVLLLKGDKSDGCSKKTSLYITCLVLFIILEDLMLDVVCNTIFGCGKQRVNNFIICCCTWIARQNISIDRYNQLPLFSDIANFMKEIHFAKYNRRGDVVMQCHHHLAREGEVRIVSVMYEIPDVIGW